MARLVIWDTITPIMTPLECLKNSEHRSRALEVYDILS